MPEEPELTAEQRSLVEQPASARVLVTAGAGSGKTMSLVHRVAQLLEDGLDAVDVLVLSFSRAAVREVRNRLRNAEGASGNVDVRTFDSYATWLLSELDPDGSWKEKSFEGRIEAATHLIRDDEDATELVSEVRHLVVDEVQDLVGARAELVKALLESDVEGFTLLGDPAQGIYGFQVEDRAERLQGAAALYEWIRTRFDDLAEFTLSANFRAREPEARAALDLGPQVGEVDAVFPPLLHELRTRLLSGDTLGTLDDAARVLAGRNSSTAILCRTNAQTLLISRRLHELGVPHRLQRAAEDRVLPSWVATIYRELASKGPAKEEVLRALANAETDPGDAWRLLKRTAADRRGETLDLVALRRKLAVGTVPDELTQPPSDSLVVSTVHRVKGLEFDQVVIVDPGHPRDGVVEQAEHTRLLYVAMTRPRDLLCLIKPVDDLATGYLKPLPDGRWADVGFKAGPRFGMEIRGSDVHADDPAGSVGYSAEPADVQNHLATRVHAGDDIRLRRAPDTTLEEPHYIVDHAGEPIGVTSESFARGMRTLVGRGRRLPEEVTNLRVDCVETVVGREAAAVNVGLGWSGVWLRPRIVGLGRLVWGDKEKR
ncbi:UvrD-helicase domain-containing protein [Streptomonospora arabica]|uniref:UvrD-helicase domain-containing protein n=1 Tax=Streptomonospora arabica TaxID=412417 RepID=A0ABV9STR1_9ACTN